MNPKEKLDVIQNSLQVQNGKIVFDQKFAEQKNLPDEIIYAIKRYVKEENDKGIEASSLETAIFPIIIWAADLLSSLLAKKLLEMGALAFCTAFKDTNSTTKLVCDELVKQ